MGRRRAGRLGEQRQQSGSQVVVGGDVANMAFAPDFGPVGGHPARHGSGVGSVNVGSVGSVGSASSVDEDIDALGLEIEQTRCERRNAIRMGDVCGETLRKERSIGLISREGEGRRHAHGTYGRISPLEEWRFAAASTASGRRPTR